MSTTVAELPRPGVEVIQVFRTVTPTILTPTLVPCIVGVAKQIVDVLETDSAGTTTLNSDALITLPGFFEAIPAVGGPPIVYAGLDGLSLVMSINNAPNVTVLFADPLAAGLTPATVVAQIQAAFTTAGVTSAVAETVGTDRFRVRTVGLGEFQTIFIDGTTSPAVLTAFGIGALQTYTGLVDYRQYQVDIPQANFPDPRSNLDELAIENDSIRVFLATGNATNLRESLRTESFLRRRADDTPGQITGTADITALVFGGGGDVDGETLTLRVDGGAAQTVLFAAPADAAALVSQINAATTGLTASVAAFTGFLSLTSDTAGPDSSMVVVDGDTVIGSDLLDDLGMGNGFAPPSGVAPSVGGPDLPAIIVGTVDIDAGPLPTTETVILSINGGAALTITYATPLTTQAFLDATNAVLAPAGAWASVDAVTGFLRLMTLTSGADKSIEITGGTGLAIIGLTVSATPVTGTSTIAAIDDGNGDAFTPLLQFLGEDFTTATPGTSGAISGTVDLTTLTYGGGGDFDPALTLELSDGQQPQTVTLDTTLVAAGDILTAINDVMGAAVGGRLTATLGGSSELVLTNTGKTGQQSVVWIVGGTALTVLGLTQWDVARGGPMHAEAGDELWLDGVLFGVISQVAPGGQINVLKMDQQVPISTDYATNFFIVAKSLTATPAADRPDPDLVVNLEGDVLIKHDQFRDTTGTPSTPLTGRGSIYLAYTAVRQDVSAIGAAGGLLSFDSIEQLEQTLEPVTTQNPLALGLFYAMTNGPGVQVTGVGVDAISTTEPFGTVAAFTRAAEFLEAFEVYALAPLTHSNEVAQVFLTHVDFMSEPENKGERIVLYNSEQPTQELDTLVASGADGNSVGAGGLTFDTGVANLSALVLAAGVSPVGVIPVSEGLFLSIASDALRYSIAGISGSVITIRTTFAPGENDDSYYSTTDLNDPPLPSVLISEAFSVNVRGASITLADGTTDKQTLAVTYQQLSQTFQNRRFWHTMPDSAASTIEGLEQIVNGFYMNAAIAGMIGQQPPQQSFTNFPMTGFTRVIGSNGFFSERQLNIIAAGGTYIIVQDTPGGPLISRFALTTDLTSIETRTDSITKVVDFTSKFIRRGIKNFIGRFNITQGFLDSLSSVLQGLGGFLVETGVLIGFNLNNVIQDEDAPDTVLVDITLDVPYPANFIRVTLVI